MQLSSEQSAAERALAYARMEQVQRVPQVVDAAQRYNAGELRADALVALHEHTLAELRAERKCAYCDAAYRWMNALGRRECAQHPGMWDNRNGRWSCCARDSPRAKPCQAQDHADAERRLADAPYVVVPRCFYEALLGGVPASSLVAARSAVPERCRALVHAADVPEPATLYWREMRRGAVLVASVGSCSQ